MDFFVIFNLYKVVRLHLKQIKGAFGTLQPPSCLCHLFVFGFGKIRSKATGQYDSDDGEKCHPNRCRTNHGHVLIDKLDNTLVATLSGKR